MNVSEFMTPEPITLREDDTLAKAQHIFSTEPIHHLLVQQGGHLTGVISDRDALKVFFNYVEGGSNEELETLKQTKAKEFMSKKPVHVSKDTDINTASILLLENNFSCLPVVDEENSIIGIVTWKDILKVQVYHKPN